MRRRPSVENTTRSYREHISPAIQNESVLVIILVLLFVYASWLPRLLRVHVIGPFGRKWRECCSRRSTIMCVTCVKSGRRLNRSFTVPPRAMACSICRLVFRIRKCANFGRCLTATKLRANFIVGCGPRNVWNWCRNLSILRVTTWHGPSVTAAASASTAVHPSQSFLNFLRLRNTKQWYFFMRNP